jgi:ABC-type Zn uptake system ZnuABC Zn-binding protein ZnuA
MYRLFSVLVLLIGLIPVASAQNEPLKVVASFSLIADVVQNIGQGQFVVETLIPVGADPHSYAPSASDLTVVADADMIFIAGGGFEEGLLESIEQAGQNALIVEISACVPARFYGEPEDHEDEAEHEALHLIEAQTHDGGDLILDIAALCAQVQIDLAERSASRDDATGLVSPRLEKANATPFYLAECAGGHDHEEEGHEEEHDEHDHGACDPHVFGDPQNIAFWTLYAAQVLSVYEPELSAEFQANAQAYLDGLDALIRVELEPLIAAIPLENRILVTNHETLGYFADAYGFRQIGFVLPGGSASAEPSARDVAALIDLVRESGAPAIFVETTSTDAIAQQVAAETDVQVLTLYSDSLGMPNSPAATVLEYLRFNITTITEALSPS